jgi:8-oxo-dGTP pyrophosphatase MutT (NUDIX family)
MVGALLGHAFWVMPGGECDPGEDYAAAARRELFEETGITADPSPLHHVREDDFETLLREPIHAVEHFFQARTAAAAIDTSGHTELEQTVMQEHRWFTAEEIASWHETIYPAEILDLIAKARVTGEV